jgi:nucleoside 2-deoxyribosyltransferase
MKTKKAIYLAGGLFNAAERVHNLHLEKSLKELDPERHVILPQRKALRYFKDGKFDINAIKEACKQLALSSDNICVLNADGSDADSGGSVEYGIAIIATHKAIVYRTDFRTNLKKELGLNSMLTLAGTKVIYLPCFFTEILEVEPFYNELAKKILKAVEKLEKIF